jgi:hypothetical protein
LHPVNYSENLVPLEAYKPIFFKKESLVDRYLI